MRHHQFIAACLCLTGAMMFGHASAQSYLGTGDLGSIRQTNQSPALSPAVSAVGGRANSVTDAQSASATINRTASERNGLATGPSQQELSATKNALDTRNLEHPRQTRSFDSLPRPSRPE
ncbi:MAG: hypothetical protein P4M06_13470 [Pandoraea sp.]|nr:hypothetical protein [Pandoraea sp.]MDR3398554.1 hypothetical protein [Pandoraea sp.]